VRVGDVVTKLRTLAAKLTYLCHDSLQKQNLCRRTSLYRLSTESRAGPATFQDRSGEVAVAGAF
jgi:hypothetical protein